MSVNVTKHYLESFWSEFFITNNRYPTIQSYQALSILSGFIVHSLCFAYVAPLLARLVAPSTYNSLSDRDQKEWKMRSVSTIHAIIAFTMAYYCLFVEDTFYDFTLVRSSYNTDITLCFSAGYFIFDTVSSYSFISYLQVHYC
jgi:hypothetical protein